MIHSLKVGVKRLKRDKGLRHFFSVVRKIFTGVGAVVCIGVIVLYLLGVESLDGKLSIKSMPNTATTGQVAVDGSTLWIATGTNGIIEDRRADQWIQHYTTKEGLPTNNVTQVIPHTNRVVAVMPGSGLAFIDKETHTFELMDENQGLKDVMGLTGALDGDDLWIGSNTAIQRMDLLKMTATTWDDLDGLPFTSIGQPVVDEKKIWFIGTLAGSQGGTGLFTLDKEAEDPRQPITNVSKASPYRQFFGSEPRPYELWQDTNSIYVLYSTGDTESQTRILRINRTTGVADSVIDDSEARLRYHYKAAKAGEDYWRLVASTGIVRTTASGEQAEVVSADHIIKQCPEYKDPLSYQNYVADNFTPTVFEDGLWFNCQSGFIIYKFNTSDPVSWIWSSLQKDPAMPAKVSELYATNGQRLFASTDLGIGILRPKKRWIATDIPRTTTITSAVWDRRTIYAYSNDFGFGEGDGPVYAEGDGPAEPVKAKLWKIDSLSGKSQLHEIEPNYTAILGVYNGRLWAYGENKLTAINLKDYSTTEYPIEGSETIMTAMFDQKSIWLVSADKLHRFDLRTLKVRDIQTIPQNNGYFFTLVKAGSDVMLIDSSAVLNGQTYHPLTKSWSNFTMNGIDNFESNLYHPVNLNNYLLSSFQTSVGARHRQPTDLRQTTEYSINQYQRRGVALTNPNTGQSLDFSGGQGTLTGYFISLVSRGRTAWLLTDDGLTRLTAR